MSHPRPILAFMSSSSHNSHAPKASTTAPMRLALHVARPKILSEEECFCIFMRSLIGFVRRMEARVVGDGGGVTNFAVVEF